MLTPAKGEEGNGAPGRWGSSSPEGASFRHRQGEGFPPWMSSHLCSRRRSSRKQVCINSEEIEKPGVLDSRFFKAAHCHASAPPLTIFDASPKRDYFSIPNFQVSNSSCAASVRLTLGPHLSLNLRAWRSYSTALMPCRPSPVRLGRCAWRELAEAEVSCQVETVGVFSNGARHQASPTPHTRCTARAGEQNTCPKKRWRQTGGQRPKA